MPKQIEIAGCTMLFLCEVLNELAVTPTSWIRTRTSPFLCWFAPLAPYEIFYNPPNPPQGADPACNTCNVTFHDEVFVAPPGATVAVDERLLAYHALIETVDASIGELLDALDAVADAEESGKRWHDKVTVILVGDNGTPDQANFYWNQGEVKGEVDEGGVRVPFIIGGKGVATELRGTTSSFPVMVADVFWTVDGLIDANTSRGLQDGLNLEPVLETLYTGSRIIYTERFDKNFVPILPATSPAIATPTSGSVTEWHRAATDGTYKVIHQGVYSQANGWQWSTSTLTYGIDDSHKLNEWHSPRNPTHDALDAFVGSVTTVPVQ